jgi:hypothetical protein
LENILTFNKKSLEFFVLIILFSKVSSYGKIVGGPGGMAEGLFPKKKLLDNFMLI